ncbi:hypothetical protein GW17_00046615 [Ensete ventricosum]|nr:hypothetical protein GW17_00046615 [Ensete ventricosum]RZR95670.1 hypothetical protein BHM03_00024536 [Ensete ventricosum]
MGKPTALKVLVCTTAITAHRSPHLARTSSSSVKDVDRYTQFKRLTSDLTAHTRNLSSQRILVLVKSTPGSADVDAKMGQETARRTPRRDHRDLGGEAKRSEREA